MRCMLCWLAAREAPPLAVSVDGASGEYVVSVDGVPWLASGGAPDHLGRNLTVLDQANSTGEDKHGAFEAVTLRWRLANARKAGAGEAAEAVLVTEFKTYAASELLALTQRWPQGVTNTSAYYEHMMTRQMTPPPEGAPLPWAAQRRTCRCPRGGDAPAPSERDRRRSSTLGRQGAVADPFWCSSIVHPPTFRSLAPSLPPADRHSRSTRAGAALVSLW